MKKIKICNGMECSSRWSKYIATRIENDKKFYNYNELIEIEFVPCMGNCNNAINVVIDKEKLSRQTPAKTSEILRNMIN